MTLEDTYRHAVAEFADRLAQVPADAWTQTSHCCPDWTVHDLVNHVVNENRWIPPLVQGRTIEDVGDSLSGDLLGDDALAAWERATSDVIGVIGRPECLEREVRLSSGPATGAHYMAEVLSDQIVHTWDLAASIGAETKLPDALVEFAASTLEPLAEIWRAAGVLGDPVAVADDADEQTRLLALLGRRS
jgi:uncharacterized protein (TIGR03086 family)